MKRKRKEKSPELLVLFKVQTGKNKHRFQKLLLDKMPKHGSRTGGSRKADSVRNTVFGL